MPVLISWRSTCVVCADLAVNAKQSLKHRRPPIVLSGVPRGHAPEHPEIAPAELLDCARQGLGIIFRRPASLVVQDDPVESRPTNPDDGCAARLALERHQSKRLLRSWMHEQIRGAIMAGQLGRIGAIRGPTHA